MDIRQLRYFAVVVKEGSFSRAAEVLHISQPSLSNAIMKLENEIGFPLLERNTRGFSLTDAGHIFYKRSMDMLMRFSNLQMELKDMQEVGTGLISIGHIESSKYWMPKVVKNFKNEFPNIHLQFKDILGQEKVLEALKQYSVHLTITNQPIHHEKILLTPLYTENFILLFHKNDEYLSQKNSITLKDLTDKELIISTTGFQTRIDILHAFQKENVVPNIFYEIERLETACSLVEEGLGVTILPESYIKQLSSPNLITKSIDSSYLKRTVYLAYLKDRYLSPAVHRLIEGIKNYGDFVS
ncbi:LysR family transcriptional regulator [Neobacillus mesonae]|uniref:LysR family transcriptional regulator n=1 Tax=Neobacillus mesonae TaxID=1193713 RepID=UPI00203BE237|nr:LysR family transcriptional regulator [Neobacillus mesonae]MCM3568449.1 LysR family transcriptional regulator [Neobacillus mesonae]